MAASEKQIAANRANAQKSTGPVTEEGKQRSSMNNVKHGFYITKFWRISEQAGKLAMCGPCGEDQQNACSAKQTCMLQDNILLSHFKTLRTRNLKHRENLDIAQIGAIDTIFSLKIKEIQQNLQKTEITTGKNGEVIIKSAVSNEDLKLIMEMATHLGKNLEAMQLTAKAQDQSDLGWLTELLSDVHNDPKKAMEFRNEIKKGMHDFRQSASQAEEERELDEAINQHRKNLGDNEQSKPVKLSIVHNPFNNKHDG